MDYLSAAQTILEADNRPLHFREIARRALERKLITPSGQTPEATMGSRLYVDTKKPDSRFERLGKGHFTLKRLAQTDDIARRVEGINSDTRQTLQSRLLAVPADRFEVLVRELLLAIGFDESSVQVTSYSGDGGVDVRGVLNAGGVTAIHAAVQAKRWKYNVQSKVVRELRGSLTTHEQGIIITTSGFSKGARDEARATGKAPISLIDGAALIELLIEHGIGVSKEPHVVLTLDEEYWVEASGITTVAAVTEPMADVGTEAAASRGRGARNVSAPEPVTRPLDAPVEPPADAPAVVEPTADLPAGPLPSTDAPAPFIAPNAPPAAGYPMPVRSKGKAEKTGVLLDQSGRMEFGGQVYGSPSTAAKDASGWKEANGWRYWRYQHPETGEWRYIDELRRGGGNADEKHDRRAIPPPPAQYPPNAPPDATPDPAA